MAYLVDERWEVMPSNQRSGWPWLKIGWRPGLAIPLNKWGDSQYRGQFYCDIGWRKRGDEPWNFNSRLVPK